MVKSSSRVLDVMECLATGREPASHAALARQLGIPKSSLTGLLKDLVERRYVVFDPETARYRLGSQVLVLSKAYLDPLSLTRAGRPVLSTIIRRVNESAALAVQDGPDFLVVAQETCSHPLAHTMTIGSRAPLYGSASGKILLAFAPREEYGALLDAMKLVPLARNTIVSRAQLEEELALVAASGVAVSDEEALDGVYALAVPVRADGCVVAALSVAIPTSRLTESLKAQVLSALKEGAETIGVAMGG